MNYQFQHCSAFQITTVFMSAKEFQTTGNSTDGVQIYTWKNISGSKSKSTVEKNMKKEITAFILHF